MQEIYPDDYEVEEPIKDLSDELMLKIMANENMDEWQSSVAVIDETVRATVKFIGSGINNHIGYVEVSEFLGWPLRRVVDSFARINAIKSKQVDKQAVESLPTAKAATAFTSATRGKDLTTGQQRRVAKRIAKSENYSPEKVRLEVEREAAPKPTKKKV